MECPFFEFKLLTKNLDICAELCFHGGGRGWEKKSMATAEFGILVQKSLLQKGKFHLLFKFSKINLRASFNQLN